MRLIDAEAAIAELKKSAALPVFYSNYERRTYADKVAFAIRLLEEAPTIKAEQVKTGEWIFDESVDNHRCSRCGQEALGNPNMVGRDYIVTVASAFCPGCGAKMAEAKGQ